MAHNKKEFRIWQWNCGGYNNKRNIIQQYLRSLQSKPDIIALQETGYGYVTLTGYRAIECQTFGRGLYVLVNKQLTHIPHELGIVDKNLEYLMVEVVVPTSHKNQRNNSLFVLNIYSNPKHQKQHFKRLFEKATNLAGSRPLIILGDFNAAHELWATLRRMPRAGICGTTRMS